MATKGERTAGNIVDVAIAEFARNGYAGTSISTVAKKSCLNKSSVYAHFESKADLFNACIREATERRFKFLERSLDENRDKPIEDTLYNFLMLYDDLGDEGTDAYFHERFAYFPPEDLKEETTNFTSNVIIVHVQEMLEPVFDRWAKQYNIKVDKKLNALIAFMSIYDGLIVERLIGNREKFVYRLEHTWPFYTEALKYLELLGLES